MVGIAIPHQDAAQVGMPGELDAEHIEGLALVPVGPGPQGDDTRHGRSRIVARAGSGHPNGGVRRRRIKMINGREARRSAFGPVDRGHIREQVEPGVVAQGLEHRENLARRHVDGRTVATGPVGDLRKFRLEGADGVDGSGHLKNGVVRRLRPRRVWRPSAPA